VRNRSATHVEAEVGTPKGPRCLRRPGTVHTAEQNGIWQAPVSCGQQAAEGLLAGQTTGRRTVTSMPGPWEIADESACRLAS